MARRAARSTTAETENETDEVSEEETSSPEPTEFEDGKQESQVGPGFSSRVPGPSAGFDPTKLLYQTQQYDQGDDKSRSVLHALSHPPKAALKAEAVAEARSAAAAVPFPSTVNATPLAQEDKVRNEADTAGVYVPPSYLETKSEADSSDQS